MKDLIPAQFIKLYYVFCQRFLCKFFIEVNLLSFNKCFDDKGEHKIKINVIVLSLNILLSKMKAKHDQKLLLEFESYMPPKRHGEKACPHLVMPLEDHRNFRQWSLLGKVDLGGRGNLPTL